MIEDPDLQKEWENCFIPKGFERANNIICEKENNICYDDPRVCTPTFVKSLDTIWSEEDGGESFGAYIAVKRPWGWTLLWVKWPLIIDTKCASELYETLAKEGCFIYGSDASLQLYIKEQASDVWWKEANEVVENE